MIGAAAWRPSWGREESVCIRIVPLGKVRAVEEVSTWSSMTGDILALRDRLIAAEVTCVVMEATGDYWKPFYYLLEDGPFEVSKPSALPGSWTMPASRSPWTRPRPSSRHAGPFGSGREP